MDLKNLMRLSPTLDIVAQELTGLDLENPDLRLYLLLSLRLLERQRLIEEA